MLRALSCAFPKVLLHVDPESAFAGSHATRRLWCPVPNRHRHHSILDGVQRLVSYIHLCNRSRESLRALILLLHRDS